MSVALLGFAWDRNSSYSRGPALAPRVIEAMLGSDASSPYALDGSNALQAIAAREFPDLDCDAETARERIRACVARHLAQGRGVVSLGGDHSVTFPILRAVAAQRGPVNVLHVDAHTDMYDEFEGDRFSHASPFARALEAGCIRHLVQVGIRGASREQYTRAKQHGVTVLGTEQLAQVPAEIFTQPVYVTIDLDGIDPAFAPGVSHPEPGGLTTREVLALIQRISGRLLAADVVELNPQRDVQSLTTGVAARLVKELVAKISATQRA
jgi:agmatinase